MPICPPSHWVQVSTTFIPLLRKPRGKVNLGVSLIEQILEDGMENTFSFEVNQVIHEREEALLVETDDLDEKEVWIPKSQIHQYSEVREVGEAGEMVIPYWLAQERGWV
jgi:hypothetical protein